MKTLKKISLITAFSLLVIFSYAQVGSYWVTTDAGKQKLVKPATALPSLHLPSGQFALTTTFASNNGQDGNMFDVEIVGYNNIKIDYFDINMGSGTNQVYVYYKLGTYVGYETNASAWTLAGTQNVTSSGDDVPTRINIGGFMLYSGNTYGIFITTNSAGPAGLNYTDCNVDDYYSDSNLQINAGIGMGGLFSSSTFQYRMWNGTIYYSNLSSVPFPYWTIIVAFILIMALVAFRYRRKLAL